MADRKPSVVLKDSIAALEALSADPDADEAAAIEANKQIKVLRTKVQAAAFDNMASRTQSLQMMMAALDAVANKAGGSDSSESIAKVRGLLAEAKNFVDAAKGGL